MILRRVRGGIIRRMRVLASPELSGYFLDAEDHIELFGSARAEQIPCRIGHYVVPGSICVDRSF